MIKARHKITHKHIYLLTLRGAREARQIGLLHFWDIKQRGNLLNYKIYPLETNYKWNTFSEPKICETFLL